MQVREIRPEECLIAVEALPEIFYPEEHLDDPDEIARAEAGWRSGDDWRWAMVKVTVWFGPIMGTAGAGCQSFEDEAEFRASQLFNDLVGRAITEIRGNIQFLLEKLDREPEAASP